MEPSSPPPDYPFRYLCPFPCGPDSGARGSAGPFRDLEMLLPATLWSPSFVVQRTRYTLHHPHFPSPAAAQPTVMTTAAGTAAPTRVRSASTSETSARLRSGDSEGRCSISTSSSGSLADTISSPASCSSPSLLHASGVHAAAAWPFPKWSLMAMQRAFLQARDQRGMGLTTRCQSPVSPALPSSSTSSSASVSAARQTQRREAELLCFEHASGDGKEEAGEESRSETVCAFPRARATIEGASDNEELPPLTNPAAAAPAAAAAATNTTGGETSSTERKLLNPDDAAPSCARSRTGLEEPLREEVGSNGVRDRDGTSVRAMRVVEEEALVPAVEVLEGLLARVQERHRSHCPLCSPDAAPTWFCRENKRKRRRHDVVEWDTARARGETLPSNAVAGRSRTAALSCAATHPTAARADCDGATRREAVRRQVEDFLEFHRARVAHLNATRPVMYRSSTAREHELVRRCRAMGGIALLEALCIAL